MFYSLFIALHIFYLKSRVDSEELSHRISLWDIKILYKDKLSRIIQSMYVNTFAELLNFNRLRFQSISLHIFTIILHFLIPKSGRFSLNDNSEYKKLKVPKNTDRNVRQLNLVIEPIRVQINIQSPDDKTQLVVCSKKGRLQVESYFYLFSPSVADILSSAVSPETNVSGPYKTAMHFIFSNVIAFIAPTDVDVYNDTYWVPKKYFVSIDLFFSSKDY